MNIVMANNYLTLRGGSERVMLDETAWFRRHGHEVSLFGRIDANHTDGLPYSELMPPIPDLLTAKGFTRLRLAKDIIYNRNTGLRFRKFLHNVRPDIVHCHNIYAGLTTAVVDECERASIPCLITLHDYKLACPSYLMLRNGKPCSLCFGGKFFNCAVTRCHKSSYAVSAVSTFEAYFNQFSGKYRKAKRLIAPSQFLLEQMVAAGIPRGSLLCIPNGINVPSINPAHRDGGYCLYLGRLSEEKGLLTLLAAMRNVQIPLRMVGQGPAAAKLKEFANVHRLAHVTFEGYKSGAELDAVLTGSAFVVVPSEWYENASMTVLEAMAQGKPVIASRIGGLPEQIENNVSGLLVEPGNTPELSDAINSLAAAAELRRSFGNAARKRFESQFSLDRHCNALLALYREVVRAPEMRDTQ